MKSSQIFSIGASIAIAAAQISNLPACGQTCINNMLALAPSLGCATPDAACLCRNINFAYGVRDCSTAACGAEAAAPVIAYGNSYCAGAGTTGSLTGTAISSPLPISGAPSSPISGPVSPTSGAASSAITTSAILSTIVSGSNTLTSTIGSTTIYGGAAGSSGSSAIATSAIVTTVTSGTQVLTSTLGSTTIFGLGPISSATSVSGSVVSSLESTATGISSVEASSTSSAASSETPTSTSSGSGARQTAVAGLAAAAGLAVLML